MIADFLFSHTFWILFDDSKITWIRSNGNIFHETALAEWVTRKLLKLKIVSLFSYLLCWEIDKMHKNVWLTQNTLVFHALTFILLFYLWTACWWGPFGCTMLPPKTKWLRSCNKNWSLKDALVLNWPNLSAGQIQEMLAHLSKQYFMNHFCAGAA